MGVGLILLMVGIAMLGITYIVYLLESGNVNKYTESELVDFGNFLLSKDRLESIESEENKRFVHDVDLRNWEDK
ncbi:hypothetical protein [Elizabethkingia anophelis]|uniref:hypothetical protein n=1 Tax=Elizabethkingia anophelis TaxID=1117645 RepID=UPI0038922648